MTGFTVELFQNPYLPPGGTKVDGVVVVTADRHVAAAGPTGRVVELVIIDASGSMQDNRKMALARRATAAAIDALDDGVWFAVLVGREHAEQLYPKPGQLARAAADTRAAAKRTVEQLRAGGGTCIGRWLTYAATLVRAWPNDRCHALLLTDGQNQEPAAELDAALNQVEGVFQCDCRGVGADWRVDELRSIASTLFGTVDIIPTPDEMEAEFRSLVRQSMARRAGEVVLDVWTPRSASVHFVKQVLPFVEDVTGRRIAIDDRVSRFPLGAWGDETRAYHLWVDVPPQDVDEELLAARVTVSAAGEPVGTCKLLAVWTDEPDRSTVVHPVVAHYTGQTDMAAALDRGTAALRSGDRSVAEAELGAAAKLAAEAGNDDIVQRIANLADDLDPATGTLRLRARVEALDERILEAVSTKTVPVDRRAR